MEGDLAAGVSAALSLPAGSAIRARRRRRLTMALVVLLLVVPPFAWTWAARSGPSDGTVTFPTSPRWSDARGVGIGLLHGGPGCLEQGDLVTHVDGVALDVWVRGRADRPAPRIGDSVAYQVRDAARPCYVLLRDYPFLSVAAAHLMPILLVFVMWSVAAFVFLQRPRDPAARALFGIALLVPYGAPSWPFGMQVIDLVCGPRLWPYVTAEVVNALLWGAVLHFATVFPQPLPLLRRHPWAVLGVYSVPFLLYAGTAAVRHAEAGGSLGPHALVGAVTGQVGLDTLGYLAPISVPSSRAVPVLVMVTLIWQYRHTSSPGERARLRWVLYAFLATAVVYVALGQVPAWRTDQPLVPWDWFAVAFVVVPLTLGAAVLRYGLFDVQVILRRSLVYGVVTVTLVVVPGAAALMTVQLLADPTGWELLLLVALVVTVCLLTLRVRLTKWASRLIFGHRDNPYAVMSELGQRLQSAVPADSVLPSMAQTLADALRLPYVGIQLTGPDGVVDIVSHGTPEGHPVSIPLSSQGEEVGQLLLDPGTGREPFGPSDRRLLELVAQQVGLAADRVLLTSRLQRSLQRAVTVREEERRRLRRDIHDGLGPALAATGFQLEVARRMLADHPETASAILEDLCRSQRVVVHDVAGLVDGLRPPVLDQLGLLGALRAHAETVSGDAAKGPALLVTVDGAGDVEPLPAAVEVAAYRVVLEALTNVVRHASASESEVRIWREDDSLVVQVDDNGRGLPKVYRAGVGLSSMRERAIELGGSCTIVRLPDGGSRVRAEFPLLTGDSPRE